MKTIFSIKSYFTILLTFAFAILNFYFIPFFYNDPYYDNKLFPKIFVPTLILFSFLYLFFGEVRTKIIIVDFKNKEIIVKRFLGLKIDNFKFSKIEGWKYSMLISNGGFYEYLYLIDSNNKKSLKFLNFITLTIRM